jgi:hypothetical protein
MGGTTNSKTGHFSQLSVVGVFKALFIEVSRNWQRGSPTALSGVGLINLGQ